MQNIHGYYYEEIGDEAMVIGFIHFDGEDWDCDVTVPLMEVDDVDYNYLFEQYLKSNGSNSKQKLSNL